MSNVADRWRTVAGSFTERVRGVPEGAWENPSPCEGWTARDLVRHLTEWVPAFLAAGSDIRIPEGPAVDDDPVGAWVHLDEAIEAELDTADVHDRIFDHERAGTHRLDDAIDQFVLGDVLIHTWDLARATGQDERLDQATVDGMLTGLEPIADVLAESGQYGPRVAVADDADAQARLLAVTGRHP